MVLALHIMCVFSNHILFTNKNEPKKWLWILLIYQIFNSTISLISFAILVKVHRANFNLIDIIVGIHGTILSRSKPAIICYSLKFILWPFTKSLFTGHVPFNIFVSILIYILFVFCFTICILPLTGLNPFSPLWSLIAIPYHLLSLLIPVTKDMIHGMPLVALDSESLRIGRAQTGTYSVHHLNGSFISYHPPYGNAMGRLQSDIMHYEQILRRQEEQQRAIEIERRARMFDDMERRGVQFATYTYFT